MGSPPDTSRRTRRSVRWRDIGGLVTVLTMLCLATPCLAGSVSRNLEGFVLGFNTHKVQAKDQPLLQSAGIRNLRVDLYRNPVSDDRGAVNTGHPFFQAIADTPAVYDQPLVILGYGHRAFQDSGRPTTPESRRAFVDYALASVGRLHERTRFFEIWNEWNVVGMGRTPLEEGTGRVEDYVTLLKETYIALKRQFPDLVVLGGATGGIGADEGYMEKAVKLGMLQWLDGLSIHPYFYGAPGDARLPEQAVPERMGKLREWQGSDPGHARTPIYITELGWPTYKGEEGVTLDEQASYMVRTVLLFACEPQVKGIWLYEFRDGGGDPGEREHHFGVIEPDGSPKPSFYAVRDVVALLDQARSIEAVPNNSGGRLVSMRLAMKDGSESWICWTVHPGEIMEVDMRRQPGSASLVATTLNVNPGQRVAKTRFLAENLPLIMRGFPAGTRPAFLQHQESTH